MNIKSFGLTLIAGISFVASFISAAHAANEVLPVQASTKLSLLMKNKGAKILERQGFSYKKFTGVNNKSAQEAPAVSASLVAHALLVHPPVKWNLFLDYDGTAKAAGSMTVHYSVQAELDLQKQITYLVINGQEIPLRNGKTLPGLPHFKGVEKSLFATLTGIGADGQSVSYASLQFQFFTSKDSLHFGQMTPLAVEEKVPWMLPTGVLSNNIDVLQDGLFAGYFSSSDNLLHLYLNPLSLSPFQVVNHLTGAIYFTGTSADHILNPMYDAITVEYVGGAVGLEYNPQQANSVFKTDQQLDTLVDSVITGQPAQGKVYFVDLTGKSANLQVGNLFAPTEVSVTVLDVDGSILDTYILLPFLQDDGSFYYYADNIGGGLTMITIAMEDSVNPADADYGFYLGSYQY